MNLGELREHPAFPSLVREMQNLLDTARDRVVRAAKEDDLEEIRYFSGRHDMLAELLQQVREKKKEK